MKPHVQSLLRLRRKIRKCKLWVHKARSRQNVQHIISWIKNLEYRLSSITWLCCSLIVGLFVMYVIHGYTQRNESFVVPRHTSFLNLATTAVIRSHVTYEYPAQVKTNPCRILLWTKWFGKHKWFFDYQSVRKFNQCKTCSCHITTDKNLFNVSTIVMFHPRDMNFSDKNVLPSRCPKHQAWLMFTLETPHNTFLLRPENQDHTNALTEAYKAKRFDNIFNLTMTYHHKSDIVLKYSHYEVRKEPAYIWWDFTQGKDRMILWYVSNCITPGTKVRAGFVDELSEYVPIDIFGKCGRPDPCKTKACQDELQGHYKFYLALENSLCEDYITEKLWDAYQNNMIPIVLGASLEDYTRIAPPNSFIHPDNFTSVQALADHLIYLNKDPNAYNRYFQWRQEYEVHESYGKATCDLCHMAQKIHTMPPKTYNMTKWWSPKQCISRYCHW